jgi:hypothetical protein
MSDKTRPNFGNFGDSGLYRSGGFTYEEYLPELRGERGRRVLSEMIRGDAIIGGILFAIDMMIRRLEWRIDPASDDPEAHKWAERIDQAREDMELTWVDTISEASSFIPYGWAVQEIDWKLCAGASDDPIRNSRFDDGVIAWRRWGIRSQDTLLMWEFDPTGTPTAMLQLNPYIGQTNTIPLDKCLHFKTVERKHNPEGISAIRNCYSSWRFKKNIQNLEAIGIERNWVGIPVAKVPSEYLAPGADPKLQASLGTIKTTVTNIRNNEQAGIVWPSDRDEDGNPMFELSFLQTGGSPTLDTDRVIQRHNHDIARSLLAGFIFLADGAGSYALSVNQTGFFARALGAWVNHMCEVINKSAIAPMMRYNGVPEDYWPVLNHGEIGEIDTTGMADTLLSLAQAGLIDVADPDIRAWSANIFGYPAPVQSDAQEAEAGDGEAEPDDPAADPAIKELPVKEQITPKTEAKAAMEPDEIAAALARFDKVPTLADVLKAEVAA